MKLFQLTLLCSTLAVPALLGNPATDQTTPKLTDKQIAQAVKKHHSGAKKLSLEQDELSADVQDLLDEQTDPEVAKLLGEIELTMAEATDLLEETNTDGATIAVETEVIEKIFDAAKKKKQKSGSG
jgi:hypothetical protein